MVNPGHPSRGCRRCRTQKVKCDEARPSCGRCSNGGWACVFPDGANVLFKSMNALSERKVQTRVTAARRRREGSPTVFDLPSRPLGQGSHVWDTSSSHDSENRRFSDDSSNSSRTLPTVLYWSDSDLNDAPDSLDDGKCRAQSVKTERRAKESPCGQRPTHKSIGTAYCDFSLSLRASMIRIGLQTAFCEDYFPPAAVKGTQTAFEMPDCRERVSGLATQAAMDAGDTLCLLQAAITSQRRDLAHEAMASYGRAIQRLRPAMAQLKSQETVEDMLLAICFLTKCETFLRVDFSSRGWQFHSKALFYLLELLDRRGSVPTSERIIEALRFCVIYALGYGLMMRKAVRYPPTTWYQERSPAGCRILCEAALRVPRLIEQMDSTRSFDTMASLLLGEAIQLQEDLRQTMLIPSLVTVRYYEVPLSAFPDFQAMVEEDLQDVFPDVLAFTDAFDSLKMRTFWQALLVLDDTIIQFAQRTSHDPSPMFESKLIDIQAEADKCADDLCRACPYLTTSAYKTCGRVNMLETLHFPRCHYEQTGDSRKAAWCRSMRDQISVGKEIARMIQCPQRLPDCLVDGI